MAVPPPIAYATPVAMPPPGVGLFRASVICALVASGVGALILLAFVATDWTALIWAGLVWLGIGGMVAFVGFVLGVVYAIQSLARGFPPPASRWRAAIAVIAPLLTAPVAFGCMVGGIAWADRVASTVIVINRSTTAFANVETVGERGARSLGPLAPGATLRDHLDETAVTLGLARVGEAANYYEFDSFHFAMPGGSPRRVTIEPDGTVRRENGGHATPTVLTPTTLPTTSPSRS